MSDDDGAEYSTESSSTVSSGTSSSFLSSSSGIASSGEVYSSASSVSSSVIYSDDSCFSASDEVGYDEYDLEGAERIGRDRYELVQLPDEVNLGATLPIERDVSHPARDEHGEGIDLTGLLSNRVEPDRSKAKTQPSKAGRSQSTPDMHWSEEPRAQIISSADDSVIDFSTRRRGSLLDPETPHRAVYKPSSDQVASGILAIIRRDSRKDIGDTHTDPVARKAEAAPTTTNPRPRVSFSPEVVEYTRDPAVETSNLFLFHMLAFGTDKDHNVEIEAAIAMHLSSATGEASDLTARWQRQAFRLRRKNEISGPGPSSPARFEFLVSELADTTTIPYFPDFFSTFRIFVGPMRVLSMLVKRFRLDLAPFIVDQHEKERVTELTKVLRFRVFNLLEKWISSIAPYDFVDDRRVMHVVEDLVPDVDASLGRRWSLRLLAAILSNQKETPIFPDDGPDSPPELLWAAMARRSDGIPMEVFIDDRTDCYYDDAFVGSHFLYWTTERLNCENDVAKALMEKGLKSGAIVCISDPSVCEFSGSEYYRFDKVPVQSPPPIAPLPKEIDIAKSANIYVIPSLEVARHLCNAFAVIWKPLTLREWSNFVLADCQNKPPCGYAILQAMNQGDEMARWVASEIVLAPSAHGRRAIIRKFIEVSSSCVDLGNYAAARAVFTGLSHPNIARLRKTWKGLKKGDSKRFRKLRSIFVSFRTEWAHATSGPNDGPLLVSVQCAANALDEATSLASPPRAGKTETRKQETGKKVVPTETENPLFGRNTEEESRGAVPNRGTLRLKPVPPSRVSLFVTSGGRVDQKTLRERLIPVMIRLDLCQKVQFRFRIVSSFHYYLSTERSILSPTMLYRESLKCEGTMKAPKGPAEPAKV